MKKVLKYVLIIVLVLVVIFAINTIRKYSIINKIENKLSNMGEVTNYYLKVVNEDSSVNGNNYNIYRRLNNMKMSETASLVEVSFTEDDIYSLNKEKMQYLKKSTPILENIDEYFPLTKYFSNFTENEQNTFEQIKLALKSSIKTTNFRETECYAISIMWNDNGIKYLSKLYINKENLSLMATEISQGDNKMTTLYETEFNTQTEEDFSKEKILEGYTPLVQE